MPLQVGNKLPADGLRDNLIEIERLDTYSFKDAAWGVTQEAGTAKAYAVLNAWNLLGDYHQDSDCEIF